MVTGIHDFPLNDRKKMPLAAHCSRRQCLTLSMQQFDVRLSEIEKIQQESILNKRSRVWTIPESSKTRSPKEHKASQWSEGDMDEQAPVENLQSSNKIIIFETISENKNKTLAVS